MAKKRSNGEGSIIKRRDGTWSAYLSNVFDPSTGKFKRKYFYAKNQKAKNGNMLIYKKTVSK